VNAGSSGTCGSGYIWNGSTCVYTGYSGGNCGAGYYFNGSTCVVSNGTTGTCVSPYVWNGTNCVYGGSNGGGNVVVYCPAGYAYSPSSGMCILVM
jgi:hypothetical protein